MCPSFIDIAGPVFVAILEMGGGFVHALLVNLCEAARQFNEKSPGYRPSTAIIADRQIAAPVYAVVIFMDRIREDPTIIMSCL